MLALVDDPHHVFVQHWGSKVGVDTGCTVVPAVDIVVTNCGEQKMAISPVYYYKYYNYMIIILHTSWSIGVEILGYNYII